MNLGLDYLTNNYYMNEINQQKKTTEQNSSVGFNGVLSTKASENVKGQSLKDMWQARFPGAYYHVMDGSKISQSAWDRNDFPFESFFSNNVDESILNWTPSGVEPAASSSEVQSRWSSTAGQKAIIVPPTLDEKMQNNSELAEKVMANVENFIATYPATPGCSYLIELDENGEISKYRVTSHGTITVSSSEFADAHRAREAKHAEYERIAEKNAIKRKLLEQETDRRYYQSKAVSAAAYEKNIMDAAGYPVTGYTTKRTQQNAAGKSFAEQVNNMAIAKPHTSIVYMKTDDMLYSGGNGTGLSFYIKYAEGSTEDDPTVIAKGVDENGDEFEQTIHINKINPKSATIVEMRALEAYIGVDKNGGLTSLPLGTGMMGLHDRTNFMDMFQKQISDMKLLSQKKAAAYYQYSMQAYWDFMNRK